MENLMDAISGETYEFTTMYPQMIKDAEADGSKAVKIYFDLVNQVEEVHAKLYQKALNAKGQTEAVDYYICSVCGYTHEGPHDAACPICNALAKAFVKVA